LGERRIKNPCIKNITIAIAGFFTQSIHLRIKQPHPQDAGIYLDSKDSIYAPGGLMTNTSSRTEERVVAESFQSDVNYN
jgi:hypothetical protein